MLAAGRMINGLAPKRMTMAVPVSPDTSIRRINGMFHRKYCVISQNGSSFAVASYYRDFHEMTDAEVRSDLKIASAS